MRANRRHAAQDQASEAIYRAFRLVRFGPGSSFAGVPGSEAAAQYLATAAVFALAACDAPFAEVIPLAALGHVS